MQDKIFCEIGLGAFVKIVHKIPQGHRKREKAPCIRTLEKRLKKHVVWKIRRKL